MSEELIPDTISKFVFDKLRARIISGDLEPGQPLREEEIRDRYGSSRGPIRESLRLLLQTGLVEHQSRRGFRVRDYTTEDIRHIYELRAKLEGMVVSDLEGRDLEPLIAGLEECCEVMRACYDRSELERYFDENNRFHQSMIDFTGNRTLAKVLVYVNEISLPIRYRLLGSNLPSRRSLTYHEDITRLLAEGDIGGAQELTEQHILENLDKAVAAFGELGGAT